MAKPPIILVCDDEAPIRQIIVHKLKGAGIETHEARNGAEGLAAVEKGLCPDMILSDFQMPQLSGLEMCQRLKLLPATAATPVLMLTARGYILDTEALSRTNIRGVIAKPFGVRQLLERVLEMLAQRSDKLAA